MGNVSGTYGNLLGGMSQQPALARADNQSRTIINAMLSPIDGLTDRDPAIAKNELLALNPTTLLHSWNSGYGKFLASIGAGTVKVWDWDGVPQTVVIDAAATSYINTTGDNLHASNVGDYLMVSNKTVTVQAGTAVGAPATTPTFWIKNVKWGQRIATWANITIGSATKRFEFAYTSPDGTVTTTGGTDTDTTKANNKFIDPSYVVWRWQYWLENGAHPADSTGPEQWADMVHSHATVVVSVEAGISPTFTFTFDGSTFTGPTGMPSDHSVSAVGTDNPDTDVVAVFRTVTSIEQLPPRSYDGHVVEVSQDDTGGFSYYMKFEAESQSTPPGNVPIEEWECVMYPSMGEYDLGFSASRGMGSLSNASGTPIGNISEFYIYHDGQRTLNVTGSGTQYPSFEFRCDGKVFDVTGTSGAQYQEPDQQQLFDIFSAAASTGSPVSIFIRTPVPALMEAPAPLAVVTGIPSGKWVETFKPGLVTSLNAATMPHALVRTGPTAFHFTLLDGRQIPTITHTESWTARTVGDDDSNPLPDFVGQTITGIGVYKDRMYLFAGESMRFSKIGLYWDLFIESAVEGGDDDGFDVASSTGQVQNIHWCVPHQGSLVVFCEHGQFMLSGDQVLTPNSAALIPVTSFILNLDVEPKPAGDVVYFTDPSGNYSNIREFYLDSITATNNARPITAHVDRLMPANVSHLIASAEDGFLSVMTKVEDGRLFVYQYVNDGGNRIQSAWHYWQFGAFMNPIYGWVYSGTLYLVVEDTHLNRFMLCTVNIRNAAVTEDNYQPRLDMYDTVTAVNNTVDINLPGSVYSDKMSFILMSGPHKGVVITPQSWDEAGIVTFADNINGYTVGYGRDYQFRVELTRPYPKDSLGRKVTGRLTINQLMLHLEMSGALDVVLTSEHYPDYFIPVDRTVGSSDALLGEEPLMSGMAPVLVNANAELMTIDLRKKSPHPLNIHEIEYRARYTSRSTRI